jgi:signal transduction histidine kinase
MTEISCRTYSFFVEAEAAGLCNIDDLLEGLPLTRDFLETPSNRMPWNVWAIVCDRFNDLFETQEEVLETAKFAINDSYSGYLAPVAGVFVDAESFYRVGFRWVVPELFRSISFALTEVGDSDILLTATLKPGFAESLGWFVLYCGTMPLVPEFIGLPREETEILHLDARSATVLVRLQKKRSVVWWKKLLPGFKSAEAERLRLQTELHHAFGKMHGVTESFRNLLDGMPVVVLAVRDEQVIYANTAYERLSRKNIIIGKANIFEFFSEDDSRVLNALFDGDVQEAASLRLITPDASSPIILSARVVRGLEFQGVQADLLVGLDVTDESQAHANLERSEATMSAMLRAQPELIFRLDQQLCLLDVKPGSDVEESELLTKLVGSSLLDAAPSIPAYQNGQLSGFFDSLFEAVSHGEPFEDFVNAPSRSGEPRHMSVRSHPLLGGRESVVVVRDETSRSVIDQRLRVAERMASVGTLAAGIAHEVNNPLAYVSLNVDLLKEEIQDLPEDVRTRIVDLLRGIADGTERIKHIIQPMRQMSRIDARQTVRTSVQTAVETALTATEFERRHKATLVLDVQNTPDVLGDPTELVQVFVNLLSNALHAMETSPNPNGHELRVRLFPEGGNVVIEIEDTGSGISKENLGMIFNPFFSTRMRETGTGLGLSIVHSIVTDMNGTIEVHSQVERGTTFRIMFLAAEFEAEALVPQADPAIVARVAVDPPRKAHVVVVDDEPMIRQSIVRVLSKHLVTCFGSGREALEYLTTHPKPDLVICDITMPGMSGPELFSHLFAVSPDLVDRMVFVTGGAFSSQTEQFLKRSDIRCLFKPVPSEVLRKLAAESVDFVAP